MIYVHYGSTVDLFTRKRNTHNTYKFRNINDMKIYCTCLRTITRNKMVVMNHFPTPHKRKSFTYEWFQYGGTSRLLNVCWQSCQLNLTVCCGCLCDVSQKYNMLFGTTVKFDADALNYYTNLTTTAHARYELNTCIRRMTQFPSITIAIWQIPHLIV